MKLNSKRSETESGMQPRSIRDQNDPTLSYVTASNSGYNPVELEAILIFGSDLGARFGSKLEDFAVFGRNGAQLSAISRPANLFVIGT